MCYQVGKNENLHFSCVWHSHVRVRKCPALYVGKSVFEIIFFVVQVSLCHDMLVFILGSGTHSVNRALPVGRPNTNSEKCSTEQLYFFEICKPYGCRFYAAADCGDYCSRDLGKKTEDTWLPNASKIQAGSIQHMVSCFYL